MDGMQIPLLILAFVLCSVEEEYPDFEHLSDDLIHYINLMAQTTWKAGRSNDTHDLKSPTIRHEFLTDKSRIPEFFDSREEWPYCPSIGQVREQAECGSCWAFAAVEVLSDRFCIHSAGLSRPHLSAEDVLTCNTREAACSGGHELIAWLHMQEEGVVTGGSYEDQRGCKPYSFKQCSHNSNNQSGMCHETPSPPTPKCTKLCRPGYPKSYDEDKYYATNTIVFTSTVEKIQREIINHGPVQASMVAYKDFFLYKSGIYQHVAGSIVYGHSVKIIGWGVENNTPYWLVVNSWNPTWGENGLFKIIRGQNECDIEIRVIAGFPKLIGMSLRCRDNFVTFMIICTMIIIRK